MHAKKTPFTLLVPSEASAGVDIATSNISSSDFGRKASRLLLLPTTWQPTFTAVRTEAYDHWQRASNSQRADVLQSICRAIRAWTRRHEAHLVQGLIVRSSAVNETLLDRGRYKSIVLNNRFRIGSLRDAITEIYSHFLKISEGDQLGLVIQAYVDPVVRGHLSNEVHLSPTRNQWRFQIEKPHDPIDKGANPNYSRRGVKGMVSLD